MSDYEVIIAGASFAGLAVAAELRGRRVLVLDRKPIGTGQTSACGTLVATLRALRLEDAICQVHEELVIHGARRTRVFPLEQPYCTFDYARLCHLLWAASDAEFIQAPALGMVGPRVLTPRGEVAAPLVVDATGWRATLAAGQRPGYVREERLGLGLETTVPYEGRGLHFWFFPLGVRGLELGWAFPAGGQAHVGLGAYRGRPSLREPLEAFADLVGVQPRGLHGGRFPTAPRDPVVGALFVVGDAAGHCLPLTAEGIRPALYFGTVLGRLLRAVLEGRLSADGARQAYRTLGARGRWGYRLMAGLHGAIPRLPLGLAQRVELLGDLPGMRTRYLPRYQRAFALE